MSTAPTQLPSILATLKAAQTRDGAIAAEVRIDRLTRLLRLLDQHAEAFCEAIDQDFGGRSKETSLMNDIMATFSSVKYARSQVKRWMKPDRRAGVFPFNLFGARVEVRHEPKGVVGILGTWNVPLFTTLTPLAFVLAGGNRAMIKPSEVTPRTSALLQRCMAEYFAPDEVSVVTGEQDLSMAFSALPFDHLIVTGSANVGRAVMRAAADNLVPVTLELGGKSPVIVGRSADLDLAADRIITGKTMNGGQICVTPDTVYVPADGLEAFVAACQRHHQRMYPGQAGDAGLTAIVSDRHHQRIQAYLDELQACQARVENCAQGGTPQGRRLPLRLAINPPRDSRLAREEIFGPVLQIETYQQVQEAIDRINAGERPLALYYFGTNAAEERHVLDHTRSGGVTVNDVLVHVAAHDAPFGGNGGSGMGVYHGREGFLEFTHPRTVYRSGWWDPRKAFGLVPPYSEQIYGRLRKTLKP